MSSLLSQIVLLIAFLCITLLVASLVCLTLPGDDLNTAPSQTIAQNHVRFVVR